MGWALSRIHNIPFNMSMEYEKLLKKSIILNLIKGSSLRRNHKGFMDQHGPLEGLPYIEPLPHHKDPR